MSNPLTTKVNGLTPADLDEALLRELAKSAGVSALRSAAERDLVVTGLVDGKFGSESAGYLFSFTGTRPLPQGVLAFGDLVVDPDQRTVEVSGAPVYLHIPEFGLLKVLLLHKDLTLTKEMLWKQLTSMEHKPENERIDYYIKRLRRKLLDAGSRATIEGNPSQGYFLSHEADGAEHSSVA
jgi:DNA-binding response OmpR family regulator